MCNHDLSTRLARWALALQRYRFKIEHRKRSLNVVPDSLSRVNEDEVAAQDLREGIGTTPYYMAFGQHMVTSGSTYALLRKLNMLDDRSLVFDRQDSFQIIREEASKQMQRVHDRKEKRYNLRSTVVSFVVGQEVFRRIFRQSCFHTGYNAKLGPSFVKARIKRKVGNNYYELEDLQGRLLGNYHAKDIRQ
ncbi:hypothetical protein KR026_010745 [Drosophila bipectinata]|nr:hypothetical protein KR026_010745 [Drosophila bipectinata]